MRGGTSKGLFFHAEHLPADPERRDAVLLSAVGSPDPRQIDGIGGAHPLTSKIAVVGPPTRTDADVDYLFLQAAVDQALIGAAQTCGNLLAAVGPFAIDSGLAEAGDDHTDVRIHLRGTGGVAVARVQTPGRLVTYEGDARIDGVPGTGSPVMLEFLDTAGSSCGALLPTGSSLDRIDGLDVTCIDNGMPVILIAAADLGLTGYETPRELDTDVELRHRIEALRLSAGGVMNLGDVASKTVPKVSLVAPPAAGGTISTRTFIPHRVHEAIGVLGAVSVATACLMPGSVAARVAAPMSDSVMRRIDVEHPGGFLTVDAEMARRGGEVVILRTTLLRTARLLMRGEVYVPACVWGGA